MSEQRETAYMGTDAHGLPVAYVNEAEAAKAEECATVRDALLFMAEDLRREGAKAQGSAEKARAYGVARQLYKHAQAANATALRHRDRSTGNTDAA